MTKLPNSVAASSAGRSDRPVRTRASNKPKGRKVDDIPAASSAPDTAADNRKLHYASELLYQITDVELSKLDSIFGFPKVKSNNNGKVKKSRNKIKLKDRSVNFDLVKSLLTDGLAASFKVTEFPDEARDLFIERIASALIAHQLDFDISAKKKKAVLIGNDAPTLPAEAPIKWKDREPGESAPEFTRRVYSPYGLATGISKQALRALDPALVNELNAWTRDGNEMPADIKLLRKGEENMRLLSAGAEAIKEHLGKFTGIEAVREAQRLHNARYRQK